MKSNRAIGGPVLTALLGLGLAAATPAHASFFQNSTGLASPTQTLTFDEVVLPVDTPVTNQYAAYGVTFTPNLYYDDYVFPFPNFAGHRVGNFAPDGNGGFIVQNPIGIHFTTPQTAAAFALETFQGTSSFIALLNGNPVETDTAPTDQTLTNDYYGFQNIVFDEIRIAPGGGGFMELDNLETIPAPVPEPGSLALLATGGLPLLNLVRRRRRMA